MHHQHQYYNHLRLFIHPHHLHHIKYLQMCQAIFKLSYNYIQIMSLSCLSVMSSSASSTLPPIVSNEISNKFLYYNMEQSPPTDQWPNGYNSTISNAVITSSLAKYGTQSATSDGLASSTIYMYSTSSTLSLGSNTGVSFSMWFYVTGLITTGDCKIFEAGGNNKYFIRIPNNTSTFYFCDKGSATSFSLNTWNHVVGTVNSSNAGSVYLNGTQVTTYSGATGLWTTSLNRVYVCRSTLGSHNSIKGNIDDFRIYSKVLSAAEVSYIYNNTDE